MRKLHLVYKGFFCAILAAPLVPALATMPGASHFSTIAYAVPGDGYDGQPTMGGAPGA